jgi:hypothetical protein
MSGATSSGTPVDTGSTLDNAAADIGKILARESGQARAPDRQQAPRREPTPRVREDAAPQAEAEPDEALPDEGDEGQEPEELEEDDAGEEEAPEEGEETEDGSPREQLFTVKLPDGKEARVPASELVRGYQREQDYTRKMMAFHEQRRVAEQDFQAIKTERAQYAELIPILQQQLHQAAFPQIDWERLRQENPVEYAIRRQDQRELLDQIQAGEAEKQRVQYVTALQDRAARTELLQRERAAAGELVPVWKSDEAWDKARAQARAYATELGYSADDIRTVTDHRAVFILWQAAQHAAMMKKGRALPQPAPVRQLAAPAPGPHPLRRRVTEHTRNKQRLAQTHSVRDAAAVIDGLL